MLAASAAEQAIASAAHLLPVAAAGRWAFSIVHGDVEDRDEQLALDQLARLAERTGHLVTTYGTNDTTAYVFDGAGGRLAVLALQGAAVLFGRSWWRTHTRFGGDA